MIIPISSKFGEGARASFFANIFPKAVQAVSDLPDSVLKTFALLQAEHPNAGSKELVYRYGCMQALAVHDKVCDKKVLADIRRIAKGTLEQASDDVLIVAEAILQRAPDQRIVDQLPLSITSFFSRYIADALNECSASVSSCKEILAGKDFLQVNLNIAKWHKGEVKYGMLKSSDAELKIIGSTSAIADYEAKHGTLNYVLKYPN